MKKTQDHATRRITFAILGSIGALIVASLILTAILKYTPITPLAKILNVEQLNPNNPGVQRSPYVLGLLPAESLEDALIATPIAMLVAGLVLGLLLRRAGISPLKVAVVGAATGFATDLFAQAFPWIVIGLITKSFGEITPNVPRVTLDLVSIKTPAAELALSVFAYALGAWLVTLARRAHGNSATTGSIAPTKA